MHGRNDSLPETFELLESSMSAARYSYPLAASALSISATLRACTIHETDYSSPLNARTITGWYRT
jgi:hypothetical protein